VAIVNKKFADHYFPRQNAVGKRSDSAAGRTAS
jgi:hypothetical protein